MEKTNQRLTFNLKGISGIKRLIGRIILSIAFLAFGMVANAQAQGLRLISDEETEQLLAQIIQPLFKTAGVRFNRNNIYIVEDPSLNAFVSDGNALFIHTGTITAADSPNELEGVIAHETGHIMGGHILRQKLKNQAMSEVTLASALLAGTAAVLSGRGDAAMAVMLGAQSSALHNYLSYRTEEERSADDAAMKILKANHESPAGMLRFMKRISQQNTLSGVEENPYFRTHPVTSERISFFEEQVKNSNIEQSREPLQENFERVKAKLYAYLNQPAQTYKKYPNSNQSTAAQYARAIAKFKQLKFKEAQKGLDRLIEKEPGNPYFHELKGQIFLETGKIKPAIAEYRKALSLRPSSALLQSSLAQAILEDDSAAPAQIKEAVTLLTQANRKRPAGFNWLLLARAYGLSGEEAAANYASAEYSLRIGATDAAERQAKQALATHPSPKLALKIDDLLLRISNLQKDKK